MFSPVAPLHFTQGQRSHTTRPRHMSARQPIKAAAAVSLRQLLAAALAVKLVHLAHLSRLIHPNLVASAVVTPDQPTATCMHVTCYGTMTSLPTTLIQAAVSTRSCPRLPKCVIYAPNLEDAHQHQTALDPLVGLPHLRIRPRIISATT